MSHLRKLPGLRTSLIYMTIFALIIAIIGAMQPILERMLGGGTLFANKASAAQEVAADDEFEDGETTKGTEEDLQIEQSSPPSFEWDDPVASLALAMQTKLKELDEREKGLDLRKVRLDALAESLDEKMVKLTRDRAALLIIDARIAQVEDKEHKKTVSSWVDIFSSTDPLKAADVFSGFIDDPAQVKLGIEIFENMEPKKAGKIWDKMDPEPSKVYADALDKRDK